MRITVRREVFCPGPTEQEALLTQLLLANPSGWEGFSPKLGCMVYALNKHVANENADRFVDPMTTFRWTT